MEPIETSLTDFSIVLPKHHSSQKELIEWTSHLHEKQEENNADYKNNPELIRKLNYRYSVKENQISQRYYECHDPKNMEMFERHSFFADRSIQVFKEFYSDKATKPDHIIHVTCTGYVSPSAPQILISNPQWNKPTNITHAYHMGCYGALPSVRIAEGFVSHTSSLGKPDTQIDLVHTEICSLHMNAKEHSPEQLVVQSLFADGHVKYSAFNSNSSKLKNKRSFKILQVREHVVPNSSKDMTWIPASWGMHMTLSRDVPEKIKHDIKPFIENLVTSTGLSLEHVLQDGIFAIHPGGPKIIQTIEEVLELKPRQTDISHKILLERGNMSSATLPHIWKEILDSKPRNGIPVVSLAFGPGLTIFGSLFITEGSA